MLDATTEVCGHASRTVKFLRGQAVFVPRDDDIYVASYPRSGTTLTQVLVHLLVTGRTDFSFEHLSEVSPWWERSLAWRSESPDLLAALPSPRVFKTHLPRSWLPDRGRFLYVVRAPADVALSYYFLYRRYLRYDGDFRQFFDKFLAGDVQYGSCFRHVAGWRKHAQDPDIHFLDYEDLVHDGAATIRQVADFLGIEPAPERIQEILDQTRFARMKRDQEKFDHEGELLRQWGIRAGDFLRSGTVGEGDATMSPQQRTSLAKMEQRKYLLPHLEWRLPAFLR